MYVNLLSKDPKKLIEFYKNVVGLEPMDDSTDVITDKWYGFNTGKVPFAIEPMTNRDKYTFDYAKGNPYLIQFKANSRDELIEWTEKLEKNNVNIGQRLLEKSYGVVTTFTDPDGNPVELLFEKQS